MSFNEKVVIVTGASSGIGAAIAEKFSSEGARVVMVGRNESKLNAVAARCKNPLIVKAELGKEEDIVRIIDETIKEFGKIDILVNNAGTSTMGSILLGDILKSYDEVMNVNFKAIVHLTKLAAPHLIATKGNIINISSIGADRTTSVPALMMYSCSKAALNHFSKDVALELSPHKVRVNVISPGPVRTDILENTGTPIPWEAFQQKTALDRISEPEEIADLALFLASEKAKGITGSIYVTDNGMSLKN
ncbi:17-beta-hydroxysteroid dehydrogenase 14-like [Pieris rapae]|uniref:17-beta-hydroxysteroid dehydrogenase 14-like n=1 Tax=Pieris rapae TaxID=64459 RepID=UPI001E280E15|nr:17-beta-hydroxysteroid dehydrogenase 14-like [Pieris rapae]